MTTSPASETPDTLSEAVALLQAHGYTGNFDIHDHRVTCPACNTTHEPKALIVERVYRFEGPSDPADESIVFGVRCPSCGARGVLVSPYGPDADPEVMQQLSLLARKV